MNQLWPGGTMLYPPGLGSRTNPLTPTWTTWKIREIWLKENARNNWQKRAEQKQQMISTALYSSTHWLDRRQRKLLWGKMRLYRVIKPKRNTNILLQIELCPIKNKMLIFLKSTKKIKETLSALQWRRECSPPWFLVNRISMHICSFEFHSWWKLPS